LPLTADSCWRKRCFDSLLPLFTSIIYG
jgi:hypothetical protein